MTVLVITMITEKLFVRLLKNGNFMDDILKLLKIYGKMYIIFSVIGFILFLMVFGAVLYGFYVFMTA